LESKFLNGQISFRSYDTFDKMVKLPEFEE
jgi:hypothetical protein